MTLIKLNFLNLLFAIFFYVCVFGWGLNLFDFVLFSSRTFVKIATRTGLMLDKNAFFFFFFKENLFSKISYLSLVYFYSSINKDSVILFHPSESHLKLNPRCYHIMHAVTRGSMTHPSIDALEMLWIYLEVFSVLSLRRAFYSLYFAISTCCCVLTTERVPLVPVSCIMSGHH